LPVKRILLVEDNKINREKLAAQLRSSEYDVDMAIDGRQGLDMAMASPPDLIVMDMSLPEISGWDATRQLKDSDATNKVPVIALTAHALSADREKALQAGCDDYDTKPVDIGRLLGKIEVLIQR